jgi:hypothetical protein
LFRATRPRVLCTTAICFFMSAVQPGAAHVRLLGGLWRVVGAGVALLPFFPLAATRSRSRSTVWATALVLELTGGDLLGPLDGLGADEDGGVRQLEVEVEVAHGGVGLEAVAVEAPAPRGGGSARP